MVTLHELLSRPGPVEDELVLPFERRQHSRLRVVLGSGREAAVMLPRGTQLQDGDCLAGADSTGQLVRVKVVAAPEAVYRVTGEELIRAAYHLGNRHVPLQIDERFLRLARDPVLRDMLTGLGFTVSEEVAPFEPEPGAYGGGHRHGEEEEAHEHAPAIHRHHEH